VLVENKATLLGHNDWINSITFADKYLFSGSRDSTIKVNNTNTKKTNQTKQNKTKNKIFN
jgi:WD40 repeat protein